MAAGAGMTGVEGGCAAATGGVGVGKAEGEAAGACALAMATRMKRQVEIHAHISEAIFVELLGFGVKNWCAYIIQIWEASKFQEKENV